jgi:two-component system, response regulator RegA
MSGTLGASVRTVLIVDDDDRLRVSMARDFERRGVETRTAGNEAEAAAAIRARRFDLVLLDLLLEECSGFDIIEDVRAVSPSTLIVILTSFASFETAVRAMRLGAYDYHYKPITAGEILAALDDRSKKLPEVVRRGRQPPSLAHHEREYIHQILGACKGNISEAARALGINRRTLQRKLQKQL